MPVKLNISLIKDIIYIGGVVVAIWLYYSNKGKETAIVETKLETVIQNQESIF
jgi:hypothetical protein